MEETPASQSAEPFQQEIELMQLVRWKRDTISGKNKMVVDETLMEDVIGECDNYFMSLVVVGSSSRRNTKLFGKLIECLNTQKNALQQYKFDENKYTVQRKGVWICSKPLMFSLKDASKNYRIIPFLIVEVQSTRDEYTRDSEIHKIFELGLLLSSVLILNFTESVDENILRWFGDSNDFAQGVVCFPDSRSYAKISPPCTPPLDGPFSLLCKQFQTVVLLIGDFGLNIDQWFSSGNPRSPKKGNDLRTFLYGDEKFITKSSKCSRDFIFKYFGNVICSFSSVNTTEYTIPDVSFIFDNKDNLSTIKLLWGVPLQIKFYKQLLLWTVSLLNDDCWDTSQYVAIRSSLLQTSASNFTEYISELVKQVFEKFLLENNAYCDGIFERHHEMLLQNTQKWLRNFEIYLDKHMRAYWCSSEIRSKRYEPDKCVSDLEAIRNELRANVRTLFETQAKNFALKKQLFTRDIIDYSKTSTSVEIEKCFDQWDNTRFKPIEEIDQIVSKLQANVLQKVKSKYPKVTFETGEMLYYVAQKKTELIVHNEAVFKRISEDFHQLLMIVIGSLVDKLIEAINNLSCKSLQEFQTLCVQQKQIHEEHFKLNEVEKFCSIVVASELPKIEPRFSEVLSTMTRRYVDRCVNNTFVNRLDVYSKLAIDIPLQDNTVTISFGNADVKYDVFPKLQFHIVQIMNDDKINTRIFLELIELGIFDTIEMERPLHGRFELEQDRVLSLMKVIQNRNSDEIQMCLQKLCNLRSSLTKEKQLRDAFENAFPDCIQRAPGILD